MPTSRRLNAVLIALLALAIILGCRAADAISARQGAATIVATKTAVAAQPTAKQSPVKATQTPTQVAILESPTDTETPELLPTDQPTETPEPSNTPQPRNTAVPSATRVPATRQPTPIPGPTNTYTPVPTPVPTRCPYQYCVIAAKCIPAQDTRAIGTVYKNGVPQNGVRVRVADAYGGGFQEKDFISGDDPMNPGVVDKNHPGFYKIGIYEGAANAGNWWVFLVENKNGQPISNGYLFNTQDEVTGNSCQTAIVDFGP